LESDFSQKDQLMRTRVQKENAAEPSAPQTPTFPTAKAGRAGQKVTVACKLPNGLILRVFSWAEQDLPILGGGFKTEKVSIPMGEPVLVHGTAFPYGELPKVLIVGGYALTPNVDADFWDLWLEQNKSSDLVRKNQVRAMEKPDDASAWAKDHATVQSGLEPINPGSVKRNGRDVPADPRMPRGGPNITGAVSDAAPPG
jgi:hypothetical protein